jgi:hypothetical protein
MASWPDLRAAFVATTTNAGNAFTAAATFPTYQSTVTTEAPTFYHEGEETPLATSTVAAATAVGARAGVYDGPTDGTSAWFKLNEYSGTTTADSSGGGGLGTLGGGATWLAGGHTGSAVTLSAASVNTNYISSSKTAVDTTKSFTVSAWLKPTGAVNSQVAISQNGATGSGFAIRASSANKWQFMMSQTEGGTQDNATSATTPSTVAWTHVVAVFTLGGGASALSLYVNNAAAVVGTHTTTWSANSTLEFGRLRTAASTWTNPWAGGVDDVRMYRRALTSTEIGHLYDGTADGPDGSWDFEDGSANVTGSADNSGDGNFASVSVAANVTWPAGHTTSATAASPNGTATSYLESDHPPIRTDQDFSISTWVRLDDVSRQQAVLSMAGSQHSAWYIYFENSNTSFGFCINANETGTPSTGTNCAYASGIVISTWYHIVATYTVSTDIGRIYLNNGAAVATNPFALFYASSGLEFGRRWIYSAWDRFLDGRIDDVTVFQRVLTAGERTTLYGAGSGGAVGTGPGLGMAAEQSGALQGPQQLQTTTAAIAYRGTANGYNNTSDTTPGPANFSLECWFRVGGGIGGDLISFGNAKTALTGTFDRQLYMASDGTVIFGATSALATINSAAGYNNSAWHHVVATLSSTAGIALYLDGNLVDSDSSVKTAGSYTGYWRWGGAKLAGWPSRPLTDQLVGSLDEVAVYNTKVLSAQDVLWHFNANH